MKAAAISKFYKLTACDGLEALHAKNHRTSFPFHFHETCNISLVYEGVFRTKVGAQDICAPPGSLLITNPLEIHANPCAHNERVSFFTFYIAPSFLDYATGTKPALFRQHVISNRHVFNKLHHAALQIAGQGYNNSMERRLGGALKQLVMAHGQAQADMEATARQRVLFKNYLPASGTEKFSLEKAARQLGINKYKFLRLFKLNTGLTPGNYFLLRRIEQGKKMLLAGEDVLGVAVALGFYDTAHFSRHFKSFTGISPAAYGRAAQL